MKECDSLHLQECHYGVRACDSFRWEAGSCFVYAVRTPAKADGLNNG